MLDIDKFLSHEKAMLIAPAGYGKTHSIAASINLIKNEGTHLILTHTHAGIASIKEKLKKENIHPKSFHVETISGFAQRYVLSFYTGKDVPQQTEKGYFGFILRKAEVLLNLNPVKKILSRSYKSLFVDEYQDCTQKQHCLIELMSEILPTRLLGDPLQGIFQFEKLDPLVEMNNIIQMKGFCDNQYLLTEPQRWLRGNNDKLGNDLRLIRNELLAGNQINLNNYTSIERHYFKEDDIFNPVSDYYKVVSFSLKDENLLIIHPMSSSIQPRLNLVKKFNNRLILLEAIDDKDFYILANKFDQISSGVIAIKIKEICTEVFNKTELDKWFGNKGLISKTKPADQEVVKSLKTILTDLESKISFWGLKQAMIEVAKLPMLKCYRKEVYNCLLKALQLAHQEHKTVLEAMVDLRNHIRRYGKKTKVRCIGTTLLTKGLEFDTVVVLNAHKFDCPKHLYVALTRASKRLIVIAENPILNLKS